MGPAILVVDDVPASRHLAAAFLQAAGYRVGEACDGLAALAALEEEIPAAIIADVVMPRMDGFALCRAVRTDPRWRAIPYVIYTESDYSAEDEETARMLGADDYVTKNAPTDKLLSTLRTLLAPRNGNTPAPRVPEDERIALTRYAAALSRKLFEKDAQIKARKDWLVQVSQQLRLQATALEKTASAVLMTDLNGTITWVNPAFTTITGYTPEEVIGRTPRILKSGRHDAAFYVKFWEAITAGETWRGEFTNRRKDGSLYIGEQTVTPVRAPSGRITHFVAIMNDITARKRAEDELHESDLHHRMLFQHHPMPMWIFDAATLQFLEVNDAAVAQYGYTREEFLRMTLKDIRPEEDVPLLLESVSAPAQSERVWRHRRKDGSILHVQIAARTVDFGKRAGRLVTVIDVTARHEAEQALRRAEAKYRHIFEDSIEGIYQTTADGRFLSANPALARMLGYATPEELIAERTDIGQQGYVQPERREEFKRLIAEHGVVHDFQYEVRRKSRGTIWVSENARVVRDAQGNVLYYEGSMIDITERKKLGSELLRSQRMESVGRLASGIAHDLNNILAPIMMAAPLLRLPLRPADVEKTLETVESSARRGADLVRQLLLFGRGAEGGRGPVDTVKLVREITRMAGETFPKNISVVVDLPASVWPMCGDVSQLHQVLLNLCVNARDAMPQGGTLQVSAANVELTAAAMPLHPDAKPGAHVVLTVSDTGTGIAPDIVDQIFDPFFTTKESGKGTGLGLSTVVGLVKSHGGFLNLRSTVNQGTTFEIYVPALPGGQETKAKPDAAPVNGKRELILVVDDEESIRQVLKAALTRHNYRVLVATDGAEASAIFAQHAAEISLVITDIDMPFMDGIKLIKLLRQLSPSTKILVSSGISMGRGPHDRSNDLRSVGVEKILAKPYTVAEVLDAVHATLAG